MANPTLQQYTEQQNNPWRKDNPTNSDYFQTITQQNMRDGMPQDNGIFNQQKEMSTPEYFQRFIKMGITDGLSSEEAQLKAIQTMKGLEGGDVHPQAIINEWDTNRNAQQSGQSFSDFQSNNSPPAFGGGGNMQVSQQPSGGRTEKFLNAFSDRLGNPEGIEKSAHVEILNRYPEILDELTSAELQAGTFPVSTDTKRGRGFHTRMSEYDKEIMKDRRQDENIVRQRDKFKDYLVE